MMSPARVSPSWSCRARVLRVCALVGFVLYGSLVFAACGTKNVQVSQPEQPRIGGTLWQGSVKVQTDDPAQARTVSERLLASELYSTLTTWDTKTLEPIPALAKSWDVSPDARQFTFFLRDDRKAENGDPINAQDVRATLLSIARKDSGSPLREHLTGIRGFSDYQSSGDEAALQGVSVLDDRTVRVMFDKPYADFPLLMGNPGMGIVHIVDDQQGNKKRYSTGPFRIESKSDDGWRMVRAPDSKAYLDAINVRFYDNIDASYDAFKRGDVDWSAIPPHRTKDAEASYGSHLFRQSLRATYLALHVADAPLDNKDTRRAIARSIDRPKVVSAFESSATPMNGLLPSDVPQDGGAGCKAECTRDVGGAKALLGNNKPVIGLALADTSPITPAARDVLVASTAEAGIVINPQVVSATEYVQRIVAADRQAVEEGWSAAYPSPGAYLEPLFRSTSSANVSGFQDATVDALLDKANASLSKSDRLRAYQDAEAKILQHMPVIPLAAFPIDSVEQKTVRGLQLLPTGNFDASQVWKIDARSVK